MQRKKKWSVDEEFCSLILKGNFLIMFQSTKFDNKIICCWHNFTTFDDQAFMDEYEWLGAEQICKAYYLD